MLIVYTVYNEKNTLITKNLFNKFVYKPWSFEHPMKKKSI